MILSGMIRRYGIMMLMVLCPTLIMAQGAYVFPVEIPPLLTTQWGQDTPYNGQCPWEWRDSIKRHALAGCGPLVMSQTMAYYQYPQKASLLGSTYHWSLLFDTVNDSLPDENKYMVAKLIRDCGRAAGTVYGKTASSTKINSVAMALKTYFDYSPYMHITERIYYKGTAGSKAWKEMIFNELSACRPIIIRAEKSATNAHVFIIDGCRDSLVHVNWGWAGKRDGYYHPDTLGGYRFNQRMIIDVAPYKHRPSIKTINTVMAGQLRKSISEHDWLYTHHIKIKGAINRDDISLLRQMAGGGRKGERNGCLSTIDMTEAVISSMPDSAFYGAVNLTFIQLPMTLPNISSHCFTNCNKLNLVRIQNMVMSIGKRAFSGCFNLTNLVLPPHLRTIGANAFNSCSSLTSMTVPKSTSRIDNGAFAYCTALRRLAIPRNAKYSNNDIIRGSSQAKLVKY